VFFFEKESMFFFFFPTVEVVEPSLGAFFLHFSLLFSKSKAPLLLLLLLLLLSGESAFLCPAPEQTRSQQLSPAVDASKSGADNARRKGNKRLASL